MLFIIISGLPSMWLTRSSELLRPPLCNKIVQNHMNIFINNNNDDEYDDDNDDDRRLCAAVLPSFRLLKTTGFFFR